MGIQSKISAAQSKLKRRLRDYSIFISGTDLEVIRLHFEENKYGDRKYAVINHDKIIIALDLPDEIPLDRFRTDITKPASVSQSTFLYDILPIVGMARFEDNVEEGDILVYRFWDETEGQENSKFLNLVLQVSEIIGSISHEHLTGRSFYCSPHNNSLPPEVKNIIQQYDPIT